MARGNRKVVQFAKGVRIYPAPDGRKKMCLSISRRSMKAGLSSLNEGQVVEYEEVPNKGQDFGGKSQGSTLTEISARGGPRSASDARVFIAA